MEPKRKKDGSVVLPVLLRCLQFTFSAALFLFFVCNIAAQHKVGFFLAE